jgi:tRNA A37 N6-isopentenylltransferase MiaA
MTQPPTTGELVARLRRQGELGLLAMPDDHVYVSFSDAALALQDAAEDLDEASARITTLERELEEARAALKLMHRRAQSAEGRVEAAKLPLSSWYKRTDPSSPRYFILRVVIKETLKALNRRAALQVEERKT